MLKHKGFTLAEVLITLAIIGVVAAITIPSLVANYQQQEYKTGLRKAVSVLNSAIRLNIALEGESPYDNANLFGYMQRYMTIIKSVPNMHDEYWINPSEKTDYLANAAFYTTDGMRYEFRAGNKRNYHKLYESNVYICYGKVTGDIQDKNTGAGADCGGCGSYGLSDNPDGTTKPPCLIMVDVNGDRKPNPANANCKNAECGKLNRYKFSDPTGTRLSDMFTIMITDKKAIPYGVAAQRAMYSGKKY